MTPHRDPRPLTDRVRGGLLRRARAVCRRWLRRGPEFPVEAALDWLLDALRDTDPELRSRCRETLLNFGCADVVAIWPAAGPDASPTSDPITTNGSFPALPNLVAAGSTHDQILAVKQYLDAAQTHVADAFDTHGHELPDTIDPDDGRMQAVCRWMETLPPAAQIADVGCGSGRFLAHLVKRFPRAELWGIDPCRQLLEQLPKGVHPQQGTLLRTNVAAASFDAAFAVESLEHCLVARRGIAELCRIVRPGGTVLVIDKHRAKQALSECEPWERWFYPHELQEWLAPLCDNVNIEFVSHSEGLGGSDLFLAASGIRRSDDLADAQ